MKAFIFIFLFFVLSVNSFGLSYSEFELEVNSEYAGKYASAFFVSGYSDLRGRAVVDYVHASLVGKKVSKEGRVKFLAGEFIVQGFRQPTHLILIIHKGKNHVLNSFHSARIKGVPFKFKEPNYSSTVRRYKASNENTAYLLREAYELNFLREEKLITIGN